MKPTVADSRTPNRLILRGPAGDLPPVTAEAAGSSPVVPAIFSNSCKTPSNDSTAGSGDVFGRIGTGVGAMRAGNGCL
jgi:hypothetical protein